MNLKEANEIYAQLKSISEQILKALGMETEPYKPVVRTRPFRNKRYQGIIFHYTGGPSAEKSMRWCNDPSWKNDSSSWHVTICDRIPDGKLGELWMKLANDALRKLFPVPTIIMADWRWGTWHGNWTNDVTLGVENRNIGYGQPETITGLGKSSEKINGKYWEPYTREQMVANINLGKLANGWIDGQLDRHWILPHMAIWAEKNDTGPLFPIHLVRDEIFNNREITDCWWLSSFNMAPDTTELDDPTWQAIPGSRDDGFLKWAIPDTKIIVSPDEAMSDEQIAATLAVIGFDCLGNFDKASLSNCIKWFQRSTSAYANPKGTNRPDLVLSPDGVFGPKTVDAVYRRLKQIGWRW